MTRIAIASCCKIGGQKSVKNQTVWAKIQAQQPELLLLLGDNVYMRQTGPRWQLDHLKQMYDEQLAEPHFAALIGAVPYMATWDDHDFGPNDSRGDTERDRPYRLRSRKLFHAAWQGAINGNRPKVYCSHAIGKVKVILLDGRYYRTDCRSPSRRTILGKEQEDWLRDELQHDLKYTLVGCGTPLGGSPQYKDSWAAYPEAHARLRALLGGAKKLVYVSGDIHRNKLTEHPEGFFEVTSSGVARIEQGQAASSDNFAILDFKAASASVRLHGIASNGQSQRII